MQKDTYTAALIIIGNEILSGRTQDKNTSWLAEHLGLRGIVLSEVRIIPDIAATIQKTVKEISGQVDYVFTTGGIGPTHDDITAENIAAAFDAPLELNDKAYQMLVRHYGSEAEVTEARAKMAMIPQGALLIDNPVSGAPGFILGNVHVMAGVPRIMQAMFDTIAPTLACGKPVLSQTVTCALPESKLAEGLRKVQDSYADVDIGSYPHFRAGEVGVSVVIRSINRDTVIAATDDVLGLVRSFGAEPSAVALLESV